MPYHFQVGIDKQETLLQIKSLRLRCMAFDKSFLPLYNNLWSLRLSFDYPQDVLLWDQDHLIGYLGVFFYKLDCPEVVLLVDPQHRHQGVARLLLNKLNELLAQFELDRYLLISASADFDQVLQRYGAKQTRVEFVLQLFKWQIDGEQKILTVRQATHDDLEKLLELHQQCFASPIERNRKRFAGYLEQPDSPVYLFFYRDVLIGKLHMYTDTEVIRLYDICVLPAYQGQQFGFALMQCWYNMVKQDIKKPPVLEVLSNNIPALKLYQKCGFKIVTKLTYWQLYFCN